MRSLPEIQDPVFNKDRKYSSVDRFFLKFINDERDLPFIYLMIKIMVFMIPLAIALFFTMPLWLWWVIAIVYLYVSNVVFKGPFGLMLHCTSHRKFFKQKYSFLNKILPWIYAPFFGQSPETYFSHHIGMHHPENNMPTDISSTMFYQRDSFKSFLAYLGRFMTVGIFELINYHFKRRRYKWGIRAIVGEVLFFAMCVVLIIYGYVGAVIWVFLLPLFLSRAIAMMGNWGQHSFVDKNDPNNGYANSTTCINVPYNHKCWNDGYHISHHIRSAMHWTEHPIHFLENKEEYVKSKSAVFEGLDFLGVWFNLMLGRYDNLAKHFVDVGGIFKTDEEVIQHLKERTKRIDRKWYFANQGK
jgi:fatty acid desaturase